MAARRTILAVRPHCAPKHTDAAPAAQTVVDASAEIFFDDTGDTTPAPETSGGRCHVISTAVIARPFGRLVFTSRTFEMQPQIFRRIEGQS